MHEIRQNKVTKEWVIFATGRGKRPHDFKEAGDAGLNSLKQKESDPACPFCPVNTPNLGQIIDQVQAGNSHGWHTRIIPNRYPVLSSDCDTARYQTGLYVAMPGYGRHEVVIESPYHNHELAVMEQEELAAVIETYHKRYTLMMQDERNLMVLIFRNHGSRAGASLIHPHSRIVATGIMPNYIRYREAQAQTYYDEWNRCVICDVLREEVSTGTRVIYTNNSFLVFIPFAAEVPYEMWIVPLTHQAFFGQVDDAQKTDLTDALHNALSRLYHKFGDPDYNYIIHSAVRYKTDEPQLHWYLQIRPRLSTAAGFEIGSRIPINSSLPEENAADLK